MGRKPSHTVVSRKVSSLPRIDTLSLKANNTIFGADVHILTSSPTHSTHTAFSSSQASNSTSTRTTPSPGSTPPTPTHSVTKRKSVPNRLSVRAARQALANAPALPHLEPHHRVFPVLAEPRTPAQAAVHQAALDFAGAVSAANPLAHVPHDANEMVRPLCKIQPLIVGSQIQRGLWWPVDWEQFHEWFPAIPVQQQAKPPRPRRQS